MQKNIENDDENGQKVLFVRYFIVLVDSMSKYKNYQQNKELEQSIISFFDIIKVFIVKSFSMG